jgi:hypothetical protein
MGNLFQRTQTRAASGAASAPASAPKRVVSPSVVRAPDHPLDPYTIPTGLYDISKCKWSASLRLVEQVRRDILTKKLAPRVAGLPDADEASGAAVECPVCFLYYCGYAINALTCCKRPMCSECYLNIQNPEGSIECPFCQKLGFHVTFEGDPARLLATKDGVFTSPHVRGGVAEQKEKQHMKLQPSSIQMGDLLKAGMVFATVADREAVKREIDAQDRQHARYEARSAGRSRKSGDSIAVASPRARLTSPLGGTLGTPPSSSAQGSHSAVATAGRMRESSALSAATATEGTFTSPVIPVPTHASSGRSGSARTDAEAIEWIMLTHAMADSLETHSTSGPILTTYTAAVAAPVSSVPTSMSTEPVGLAEDDDEELLQIALRMSLQVPDDAENR